MYTVLQSVSSKNFNPSRITITVMRQFKFLVSELSAVYSVCEIVHDNIELSALFELLNGLI